jgi:hypothetical protein
MGNWTLAIAGWAVCAMLVTSPSRAEGLPLDGFEDAIHHWQMKRGEAGLPLSSGPPDLLARRFLTRLGSVVQPWC